MIKYFEPDKEELEIEKAFEKGKIVFDKISKKEMLTLRQIAKNTLEKTKSVSSYA